jgi:WD40 repeat protein
MSANGRYAAVARLDDDFATLAEVVDVEDGRVVATMTFPEGEQWVPAVSSDGTLAVTKEFDGPTRLRSTSDGAVVAELPLIDAYDAAFDAEGRRVLVVGAAGAAGIYDTATGELLAGLEGHDPSVEVLGAGFSPDGSRALTASVDGTARIWDAQTGRQLLDVPAIGPTVRQYQQAASLALSPDGSVLVTAAGWEEDTRLWDAHTGERLATLEGAKEGGVTDAAFSADGRFLVTSSGLGKVRLWDGRTGRPLATVSDRVTTPGATGFVGDGHRIALIGETGDQTTVLVAECTVCGDLDDLVELARTRITRELTDSERATYLEEE